MAEEVRRVGLLMPGMGGRWMGKSHVNAALEVMQEMGYGMRPARRLCDHCGKPLSLTHLRIWPEATRHVTCASTPLQDGVCPHAKCCCEAHKAQSERMDAAEAKRERRRQRNLRHG